MTGGAHSPGDYAGESPATLEGLAVDEISL